MEVERNKKGGCRRNNRTSEEGGRGGKCTEAKTKPHTNSHKVHRAHALLALQAPKLLQHQRTSTPNTQSTQSTQSISKHMHKDHTFPKPQTIFSACAWPDLARRYNSTQTHVQIHICMHDTHAHTHTHTRTSTHHPGSSCTLIVAAIESLVVLAVRRQLVRA